MQEVLGVAIFQCLHQLPCEALYVQLREGHHSRVEKAAQVMVTVLED